MRRLALSLAAAALSLGAVLGASTAAAAQPSIIPGGLCVAGGGQIVEDGSTQTGFRCQGGDFDGYTVLP